MPDSSDSDQSSSPSVISSLRNFRFANKTQKYQSSSSSAHSNGTSSNGELSSSDKSKTVPNKKSSGYNALSYRKYDGTNNPQYALPCIIKRLQQAVKKSNPSTLELELKLTHGELSKVKELILQDTVVLENWKRGVIHEGQSLDSACEKVLKITKVYLNQLLKFIHRVYSENFAGNPKESPCPEPSPEVQTPERRESVENPEPSVSEKAADVEEQPDLNQIGQTKVIMDEYEVFCSKEQNLRKLLDAFPGADIMEAQDLLVKCNWNLKKAKIMAQNQPLRCSKKRVLPSASDGQGSDSQHSGGNAEEIVLDSSDDEGSFRPSKRAAKTIPRAKKARVISTSEESEGESLPPPRPTSHGNNSFQKIIVMNSNSLQKSVVSSSNSSAQKTVVPSSNSAQKTVVPSSNSAQKSVVSSANNSQKSVVSKPSSAASGVTSSASGSSMPNLPQGLVITQVGKNSIGGSNANVKRVDPPPRGGGAIMTQVKAAATTPASKPAQVVRISSSHPSSSANNTQEKNISFPKSLNVSPVSQSVATTVKNGVTAKGPSNSSGSESAKRTGSAQKQSGKAKRKRRLDSDDEGLGGAYYSDNSNDSTFENDFFGSDEEEVNTPQTPVHTAVLKFFQDSTPEELSTIPGCSKKKLSILLELRPFANWVDLVTKLRTDKYLSTDLLNGAKKIIDTRNSISKLMSKCQKISFNMVDLVEDLKSNKESSSGYVSKQPDLLNARMHLTSYQMLGLNWLLLMHNQDVNGILADEMGLGKTVQAISFLAYLKEISISGPHLIVVPSSVMDNWKQEFKTWWPDVSMICYHGSQDSRRELRMQILNDEVEEFDVMVTTYNMVTSSIEDRNFFKRIEFHYVIFDEAHMLKNMASQRYQQLMRIRAPRRLLLTGTPLQNNLVELMSLLSFAMPNVFSGKIEQIKMMFSSVSKTEGNKNTYEKDRIENAKRIMKPFILRRLKKDVLQDLPNKHDNTKLVPMTEGQTKVYEELVETLSAQVKKNQEGEITSSGSGMMMQLRRAANHPLLMRRVYDDKTIKKMSRVIMKEPTYTQSDPDLICEDMSYMHDFELHKLCLNFKSVKSFALSDDQILDSGKFRMLESMLASLSEENHRVLLFSQFTMMLDILEDFMAIKSYKYLRLDGSVPVAERQVLIDNFNSDPGIFVFLLSTKAGGLGINLTAADTVILHDIDFNPYNDKQAEDRCHRVGQVRDVNVYRFISENTIEEGILQRAKEKLKLEKDIHEEDDTEENDTASVAKLLRDALGLKNNKS